MGEKVMANNYSLRNFRTPKGNTLSGIQSPDPSQQTGTPPDQFSVAVATARRVLAKSQSGLSPKAASNTASNTNVKNLDKTIGDLADLVENTFDPVWKENYRIALVRTLAASQKAMDGTSETVMSAKEISAKGQVPDTFSHPAVGIVPGLEVSSWSARQAGYQQRFNPPPPAMPPPSLPIDPIAATSIYNQLDTPGLGTTAIPTQTNPTGSFLKVRGSKPIGTSHR
jgi:hypothetical protein